MLRLWLHDEELVASNFLFRTTEKIDNEGVANATDLAYPGRTWDETNWQLAAGETKRLEGRLKLVDGEDYQGAELRAVLYMSDMDHPEQWRVVQRRHLQIKNVPEFRPRAPCEVILVASPAASYGLICAWKALLQAQLGLKVEIFGAERYGRFQPSDETEVRVRDGDNSRLRDWMSDGEHEAPFESGILRRPCAPPLTDRPAPCVCQARSWCCSTSRLSTRVRTAI